MDNNNTTLIAGSIIIAGVIIAGAIFASGSGNNEIGQQASVNSGNNNFGNNNSPVAENIVKVNDNDHIFGDINAKISIIEFSDIQCPFCASLHPTLSRITKEYDGQVRWIYRHFPLTSIHANANGAAIASECINELGGNDSFWAFLDDAFKNQDRLGDSLYIEIASALDIDTDNFASCFSSGKYNEKVANDLKDAMNSGGRGTPYVIVISEDDKKFPFSGALPYESVKDIIEQAIGI